MATATKSRVGFAVPCPHCGATEGLSVQAHDLTITCTECSEEVTRDDLQRLIEDAQRLLRWLDMAETV